MDRDKLVKLMNLTFSDNDHEALLALRKANEILKEDRKMWGELLIQNSENAEPQWRPWTGKPPEDNDDPEVRMTARSKEEVDQTIDALSIMIQRLKSKAQREFVEGCLDFYKTRGYLTGKQAKVLQGIARGMT